MCSQERLVEDIQFYVYHHRQPVSGANTAALAFGVLNGSDDALLSSSERYACSTVAYFLIVIYLGVRMCRCNTI